MHKFSYLLGLWYFKKSDFAGMRGRFFLCFITHFSAKNTKKCKKMQKNVKKIQKNLHISKICCNFATSFKNEGHETQIVNQKNKQKNEQNLFDKKLRRDLPDDSSNKSQFPY